MKNLLNFIPAVLLSTTVVAAGDLTILNAGSKTGSFAMQSTAYAQDLGNNYNVTLDIPGDYCVAVKGILPTLTGPTLMAWASDYESTGRDGSSRLTKATILPPNSGVLITPPYAGFSSTLPA